MTKNRIFCLCQQLFKIRNMHRLKQKGLQNVIRLIAMETNLTVEDMRALKAQKFEELKNKRNSKRIRAMVSTLFT